MRSSAPHADFLAFMKLVARTHPPRELHVIFDNSSSHSTPAVGTSTRTSRIGTTTRLPSSGRNPPLRSSARGSECL